VDRTGRIYVMDRQAQDVRVFGPDGRHVRTIGRRGGGPAEFQGADEIWVDDSLRLWVSDPRSLRLSAFDSAGHLIKDYPRRAPPGHVPRMIGGEASGALWDSWGVRFADAVRQQTEAVYLVHGIPADTLRFPEFAVPLWTAQRRLGSSTSIYHLPVPFSADQLLTVDPRGGVWRSVSAEYRMTRFTSAGDSVMVVMKPHHPVPVTPQERARAVARYRRDFPDPDASMDPSLIPAVRPAIRAFLIDDRGFVWVATHRDADTAGVAFDVFDPGGHYLGVVPTPVTPQRLRPRPVIRGDGLYFVSTDDLDVQYVVRVRIAGRR
jgi:streptogramin lyase